MSLSHKNNRALKRVLQNAMRGPANGGTARPENGSAEPSYAIGADIPNSYNDAYVRAIPEDPQNSFVYWEMPKESAQNGSLGDKGTAHVGNGDAAKIRETIVRNGGNGGGAKAARSVQPRWDNTHEHPQDDNHTYLQGNAGQQNWVDNHFNGYDNAHEHSRSDDHTYMHGDHHTYSQDDYHSNHTYSQDDNHTHSQDNTREYQHHWWNGKIYRHSQDNHHHHALGNFSHFRIRKEDSDDYRYGQNHYISGEGCRQDPTLSALIESLLDQCGRYLLECRQGESGLYLPIPSSGELYAYVNNAGSHTVVSPLSSGVFYKPSGNKSPEKRP